MVRGDTNQGGGVKTNKLLNLTNPNLSFKNGNIKWVKVYDSDNGTQISGFQKL
jgi:hypothetical protein